MQNATNIISEKHLAKYFTITSEALAMVRKHPMCAERKEQAEDFLDMAQRYYDDAVHFKKKGEIR